LFFCSIVIALIVGHLIKTGELYSIDIIIRQFFLIFAILPLVGPNITISCFMGDFPAMIIAATGLANNFAAVYALTTTGIQKGHMKLPARNTAVMSGANSFEDMAIWMKERKKEIAKFLGRAFKAPAYTTIRNAYNGMDTKAIEKLQRKWVEGLSENNQELTIIATDGKTMRGSNNKEMNEKARHIVSLFLSENKLTLTQNQVKDKSNEIPALIQLLDNLNLKNCVITMDAMHTKKNSQ
jgi:hypothetical protein